MTGRDINLRDAKMEAAEAQAALQSKDEELQVQKLFLSGYSCKHIYHAKWISE